MAYPPHTAHPAFKPLACALLASLLCINAWAQSAPDAGALQRQIEQTLKPLQAPPSLRLKQAPPPPMLAREGLSVTVQQFVFAGNTLLSNAQLGAAMAPYLNRPLNFTELQAAAAAVAQAYRDAGWLVTAYLPKQEIDNGQVTLQIIEAVFGKVSVQDPQPQRVAAQRLVQLFQTQQAAGEPLSSHRVDRALLLLDDLPGVIVSGNLQAGASHSETDMVLSVMDEPLLRGDVGSDNNGAISTGALRLSLNANLNSPLRLGDQFSANAIRTQGSEFTRVAYSLPMGNDGWRAQLRGSGLNYHLVGDLAASDGHGSAQTTGAELSYPLHRSQSANHSVSLGYDRRQYDNFNLSGLTSRYQIQANTVSLTGNTIDPTGTNGYGLSWVGGKLDMSDAPALYRQDDAAGPQTAGRYERLSLNLNRLHTLTPDTSLWLAYAQQVANANLDSSEKLYLEGVSGVRAYGAGATRLGGSNGQTFTAEVRRNLDFNWRLNGFYDYGKARAYRRNLKADGVTPIGSINDFQIKGYGLTLGWQSVRGIDLKATVAKRLGQNPNPTVQGLDQDGSYRNPRYWLSAMLAF